MLSFFQTLAASAAAILATAISASALDIQFDYTYDTGSFFVGHADRQSLLNAAAAVFESRLTDVLTAITPGGSNTWNAAFTNPATGNAASVHNLTISTGVMTVYVGARQLGASTLGEGGPGGWSGLSGTTAFVNTVAARGQSGALAATPTDFGPWGGSITFDIDTLWYFGTGSLSGKDDFLSVATHELAHVLGIGTAESWDAKISGSTFTGTQSTAAHGGIQAGLSGDLGHWADGITSTVFGTSTMQEVAMDTAITVGTQKFFTTLDFAGLRDVGWTMVPEPSSTALLAGAVAMLASVRRRQRR